MCPFFSWQCEKSGKEKRYQLPVFVFIYLFFFTWHLTSPSIRNGQDCWLKYRWHFGCPHHSWRGVVLCKPGFRKLSSAGPEWSKGAPALMFCECVPIKKIPCVYPYAMPFLLNISLASYRGIPAAC